MLVQDAAAHSPLHQRPYVMIDELRLQGRNIADNFAERFPLSDIDLNQILDVLCLTNIRISGKTMMRAVKNCHPRSASESSCGPDRVLLTYASVGLAMDFGRTSCSGMA